MDNPLLDFGGLPRFDAVQPQHVAPAMEALLHAAEAALAQATAPDFAPDWQQLARTLDVATERLGRAWGVVSHLNAVADTPELRAAYNALLPRVTEFWTRLGSDEALYAKYKALDDHALDAVQRRARALALQGFVLGGAELQGAAKERFAAIQERQAELAQKFSENALDATDAWTYDATEDEVAGLPPDVRASARAAAQAAGQPQRYRLGLKLPVYLPVMQFAHHRGLRERLYRAYGTRASDQAEGELRRYDNTALMRELLELRTEEARLLGFASFAHLSLKPKMAESPEQVIAFLRDLARRARPHAERDVADMRAYAASELGLGDPQPWDWTYIAERLREARYAYSEQEVKPYFPLPRVLQGLFDLVGRLFELRIVPDQAPVWHPSVRVFRLERDGELIGQFYLDPSARSGKRGGAWMDDVRSRWRRPDDGRLQTPVAHLVCNFSDGADGRPPLLTHDDVTTLLHEFGHGLHHLLTRIDEHDVAGINGVEWDAVELPSQFLENFGWDYEALQGLSGHVDTGAALPRSLFDKMLAARNYQSGLQLLRQVEYALLDMRLHLEGAPDGDVMALLEQVRDEVAVLRPPAWHRMPHTFSHIFAGGYAAGYYSYLWAEVLSADAFAAFEEAAAERGSVLDVPTGRRFRQEILEVGGSRPALESFRAFRGRDPSIDALLRHKGLQAAC
ncbi:MAG: M3 family metallopeptidase [Tepidimonas sp.]|uniref:M3 family metallopeptidase n=1 Tax=Tepidimonas sp. TaxID=2002775 RepID=UPI00298EF01D|nr:M3 family metallopeptidase [Tepidimonas sp.]MCS6809683.1 M3 family metallopeptidase [Tepidimonas sp.]MCX7742393.1 M3 family metallopeptidase [Tepidimonas sp.]MDW8336963.1 M3 family metallopeptidase [Tepidimonas sp.]